MQISVVNLPIKMRGKNKNIIVKFMFESAFNVKNRCVLLSSD